MDIRVYFLIIVEVITKIYTYHYVQNMDKNRVWSLIDASYFFDLLSNYYIFQFF